MTNEELDEARAQEAQRLWESGQEAGSSSWAVAARLARENWTPPEPADPDVLAFREWVAMSPYRADDALCQTFLAGARMAREQEQERAKVLDEYLADLETFGPDDSLSSIPRGARAARAKYRGEA